MASGWAVSGFGHKPLDFHPYVFEDLFDGPAFFYELDLVLGHSYQYVNLEMFPVFLIDECLHRGSGFADIMVDAAEGLDRLLEF